MMLKKFVAIFISISFIFCTGSLILAADNPQDAITSSRLKFQQLNANIMDTNKQISEINIKIGQLNKNISKNNIEINENNAAIAIEKTHMEQLLLDVTNTQELANKRLRAMYINGYDENFMIILLSSTSFSDFFNKFDAIKSIINYDQKIFNKLMDKKKVLNESISSLKAKDEKLQALKASNSAILKEMNENKTSLQALVTQFNAEKFSVLDIIKQNEEKLIAHSISIIDSQNPTISDLGDAVTTLNSLVSQLTTESVKNKAKSYIVNGNKKLSELIAKNGSQSVNTGIVYKASFNMSATAYTGGTVTALGLKPVRNEASLSTIAVDPSIIPLGTKVYIPGYGNAICSDTGGAIKGNIIDLYMNTEDDCFSWGRRNVIVYVIAYPGEW